MVARINSDNHFYFICFCNNSNFKKNKNDQQSPELD